ncbi:hypothetical protein [Acinetobacter sp. P1(2025)]|uniref:hypothetical protein n=1 Tax=Acinetobacter sp. P1(2025) TaxID=3446120 RepID=UPI003F535193
MRGNKVVSDLAERQKNYVLNKDNQSYRFLDQYFVNHKSELDTLFKLAFLGDRFNGSSEKLVDYNSKFNELLIQKQIALSNVDVVTKFFDKDHVWEHANQISAFSSLQELKDLLFKLSARLRGEVQQFQGFDKEAEHSMECFTSIINTDAKSDKQAYKFYLLCKNALGAVNNLQTLYSDLSKRVDSEALFVKEKASSLERDLMLKDIPSTVSRVGQSKGYIEKKITFYSNLFGSIYYLAIVLAGVFAAIFLWCLLFVGLSFGFSIFAIILFLFLAAFIFGSKKLTNMFKISLEKIDYIFKHIT